MKHVTRFALIASLALLTAGCAGMDALHRATSATVSAKTIIVGIQAFDGAELLAANYLRLPSCRTASGPVCREAAATPMIKAVVLSGRRARNTLKAQIRATCAEDLNAGRECSKDIPVVTYNSLVDATESIQSVTAAYRAAFKN